ncbi:autoinducer binding domain-containing protein [Mesorhizobium sp.]|uniref:autoinducer binding domain-containing protein n=1 Tax=Mesorhizobium sp. TaxID=1871066 RepID=UPI0025F57829|nr:autoinducer binding domain-containing protein [Mesorhizobium sp.]
MRARFGGCSFRWDPALDVEPSVAEQRVFDEAAQFGICCGLTIPIIDLRGNFAAMTFAGDRLSIRTHGKAAASRSILVRRHRRERVALQSPPTNSSPA